MSFIASNETYLCGLYHYKRMIFNFRYTFGISLTVVIFLLMSYSYSWNFLIAVNFLGYKSEKGSSAFLILEYII